MSATKTTKPAEMFDVASFMNPDALKGAFEKASESMRDVAAFQKDALEAMMSSAGVYARGVEKATGEQTTFVKEAFDDSAAAVKATTTASSVQEALEIQTEFARAAFEKNMSFASRIADHWTSVAKEAADPLAKRYGDFVEKVQTFRP